MENKTFEEIRQLIGNLREQKGKEKETLKLIDEVLSFGHGFVVNLLFEEALTYQHLGLVIEMEKSVLKAKKYIGNYKIIELKPRLNIFLGKVYDSKKQYKKAISAFKNSDKSFEATGHLSYSMIMDGQTDSGYKLAKSTYKKFFDSKEGKELKKKDYSAWAIWMSGLVIRTINALIAKSVNFNSKEIEDWIKNTEKYLDNKNLFSYRKEEIKKLWTKLQNYKKM